MKTYLLLGFLIWHALLVAQTFTETPPSLPFKGLYYSAIAFSDVDGNGTSDLLIAGSLSGGESSCAPFFTKLYLNDGAGNFTEVPGTPFEPVSGGSIVFSDVNGDGAEDVLLTGYDENSQKRIAKLYLNQGGGNFKEKKDTPFKGVSGSSVAFSDVNGDNAPDVLITGWSEISDGLIAKLYTNDGAGKFKEKKDTPFKGVSGGAAAFSDVNGDGAPDVLITGWTDQRGKLYLNDGMGNFSELPFTPFERLSRSSAAFMDVNGDGAPDLLISGYNELLHNGRTKLYLNDGFGTGSFSGTVEVFEGVYDGSVAFSDVNGDGAPDVLITGTENDGFFERPVTKLYLNDGAGHFKEKMDAPFVGVAASSVAFSDVNGDGAPDVLTIGVGDASFFYSHPTAKLYLNDGTGHFSEKGSAPFDDLGGGSVVFPDVNLDGAPDIFIRGTNIAYESAAGLFINDRTGHFMEMPDAPFKYTYYTNWVEFSDVNGDAAPDVLISGRDSSGSRITKLFINEGDGTGHFTEMPDAPFKDIYINLMKFSDVNGDAAPDVLISGRDSSGSQITKLFINDGDGTGHFTEMPGTPFKNIYINLMKFSDVNGDAAPDVLISGADSSGSRITRLFINDGTGHFTEGSDRPFEGMYYILIEFSDVNGDAAPDVLISGRDGSSLRITILFINDGTGHFTIRPDMPFENLYNTNWIEFPDVNGDAAPDVLISGRNGSSSRITKLFINDGTGHFTERPDIPFKGGRSVAFSDVNADGTSDVLITELDSSSVLTTKLYLNDGVGYFTELHGTPFEGVNGSVAFLDANGDGAPDVFVTGETCSSEIISKLYLQDGLVGSTPVFKEAKAPTARLYPNPASKDQVIIDYFSARNSRLRISLMDLNGKLIRQSKTNVSSGSNRVPIETLDLTKGMYLVKIDDGIHSTTLKLIIQ